MPQVQFGDTKFSQQPGSRGPLTEEQRAASACRKVQFGEVTQARQCLTGRAPSREMPSHGPQQVQRPRRFVECEPDAVQVDRRIFTESVCSIWKLHVRTLALCRSNSHRLGQRRSHLVVPFLFLRPQSQKEAPWEAPQFFY